MDARGQPFIRTGFLHVPRLDAATGEAVAHTLLGARMRVVVQQESYAASDRRWLEATLCKWCDEEELDLVFTIGGTLPAPGPSGLEIVPEATRAVVERLVPGLAEAMRADVREEFPGAALHRGVAGIRGRTLVVNLPGGAVAAPRFLAAILEELPYVLAHLRSDPTAPSLEQLMHDEAVDANAATNASAPDTPPTPQPKGKGLDAGEFAAFLKRGGQEKR